MTYYFAMFGNNYGVAVCGCEPSAQRPVATSGAVPSLQTSSGSAVVTPEAVLNGYGCGCEPSAQRPVVGSGAVPSLQTSCDSVVRGEVDGTAVALNG